MSESLATLTATEQAALLQSHKISPVELTRACLSQIEKWDGVLHAWISVDADAALAAARVAEQEIMRDDYKGPLHGLPFGVKDQIHALGFPTTMGSHVLTEDEMKPPHDATVVKRLRDAGAVLLGKQNLHEFGRGGTIEFPYGQPRNPWNPAYSASSSSTGSGVAAAAHMCSFSIGEDTGGSIRGPASFNGVVGLRPTMGRVSRHGGVMYGFTCDTIGPLARSVRDTASVLQVMAGFDAHDQLTSQRPVEPYLATIDRPIAGVKLGVVTELADHPDIDGEVKSAFDAAVALLRDLGAEIVEISLPLLMYAVPLQALSQDPDASSTIIKKYLRDRYDAFDVGTRTRLASASLVPAIVYSRAMRGRFVVRRQILDAFRSVDALVSPSCLTPPRLIEQMQESVDPSADPVRRLVERRMGLYPFSLANIAAMSVPMGFSRGGLPLGLHFATKPFSEAQLFQVANAYERAANWSHVQLDLTRTLLQEAY